MYSSCSTGTRSDVLEFMGSLRIKSVTLLLCWFGWIVNGYRSSGIQLAWTPLRHRNVCLQNTFGENPADEIAYDDTRHISFGGGRMEFTWHSSIGDIAARDWDSCLVSDNQQLGSSPFLEHSWLHSLEESGCASPETGWIPCHLTIRILHDNNSKSNSNNIHGEKDVAIDGCVPVYLKTHSMGEFVFDHAWADVAGRNQIKYYPKMLVGVPFTPVAGSRFLWHSRVRQRYPLEQLDQAVGTFLIQSAMARNLSSVHINFCTDQEASILSSRPNDNDLNQNLEQEIYWKPHVQAEQDNHKNENEQRFHQQLYTTRSNTEMFLRRTSLQYHWQNRNPLRNGLPFTDFEDYLACFKSKRRITIRRERAIAKHGQCHKDDDITMDDNSNNRDSHVRINAIVGADILQVEGLVDRMFEIYRSTIDKLYWGRQYLNLDFFQRLCQTSFVHNLCFFCATYDDAHDETMNRNELKAKDVFAGTFNVIQSGVFYGRYWGCLPGRDCPKNLHFELCYWSAIDYCIQNGLLRMEPGAGGGGK